LEEKGKIGLMLPAPTGGRGGKKKMGNIPKSFALKPVQGGGGKRNRTPGDCFTPIKEVQEKRDGFGG